MAINFDAAAVHGVNSFLWSKIKADLGWKEADYGGVIPMTTPQQMQEFNDMGKPYIVYNYRIGTVGGDYGYKEEYVVYSINAPTEGEVRRALNLVDYYLGAMDTSADIVNDHVIALPNNPFSEFDYKSIISRSATGATPATQEGGLMDGSYEFSIRYTSSRLMGFNQG